MNKRNTFLSVLVMGVVPALALTSSALTALYFALCVIVLSVVSRLILVPLTKKSENATRMILIIIVNVTLVSVLSMLLNAFMHSIYNSFGIYFSLLALCGLLLITISDEKDKSLKESLSSGLKISLLYGCSLVLTGVVREVFASRSFFSLELSFIKESPLPLLAKAPGAFFVYAVILALLSALCIKEDK